MVEGAAAIVPFGGLAIGLVFGVTVQRSHFCSMGSISDAVLFGSFRRLRIWALAIAVALLGSQALHAAGLVDLGGTGYRQPGVFWLGALLGGLLFGFGMVLAGGCASRNLVRLGAGSLKAMMTLLVLGVAAYATTLGVLTPLHRGLRAVGIADVRSLGAADAGLPALLAGVTGWDAGLWAVVATLGIAALLLAFCLRDANFRRGGDLVTGLVLGALVPAGWLVTSWLGADPFEPVPVESLTFVAPVAGSLHYLMTGAGERPNFGIALVAGTLIGALATALWRGQFRLEGFVALDDMVRHLVGGALMGCGGSLALGCTIGQGLTGVSTLSLGSWLALSAIVAGGWWGVKYLETGRLLPRLATAAVPAVPQEPPERG